MRLPRSVYIAVNDVYVHLPGHPLGYGHSYFVTVDAGVIQVAGGTAPMLSGNTSWQFQTRMSAPSDLAQVRVALDGTGQFCSVQGALDALPARNTTPATITIGRGPYYEAIHATGKNDVTLHGEDRKATIIAGVNNNNLNAQHLDPRAGFDREQQ